MDKNKIKTYLTVIIGSSLFAISMNLFIVPLNLFSNGLLGFSQVVRSIVNIYFESSSQYDWSGYLYALLNIPLYIFAYRGLSHKFFYLSILSTVVQSIVLVIIPIPQTLLVKDYLTSAIVGGVIGGVGIGLCLREGGSGGGFDIPGMYYALKSKNGSVGKLSMILNSIIFTICAFLFNIEIAIYSIIYVAIFTLALDRFHTQNIPMHVMIFSKNKNAKQEIINQLKRGATYWEGKGAYTNEDTQIVVTVISKYELAALKKTILELDPQAFIIISDSMEIVGNYEKRLLVE